MQRLRYLIGAAVLVILVGCTPAERALWDRWHAVDPYGAETETAQAATPAGVPTLTPTAFAALEAHVAELEALPACLLYDRWLDAAGLPAHFHAIMRRESMCQPGARNRSSGAAGLLQILPSWAGACGTTAAELFDPATNIRCGVYIYERQGGGAWSTW